MYFLTNDRRGRKKLSLSLSPTATECQERTGSPMRAPSPAQRGAKSKTCTVALTSTRDHLFLTQPHDSLSVPTKVESIRFCEGAWVEQEPELVEQVVAQQYLL
jgi:hypothetical protein